MVVNIHEAKTHFSRLLQRVANGEEITIARAGVPVAKLSAVTPSAVRPLGAMQSEIYIADDFDAPLPDDVLGLFYGEEAARKKPSRAKAGKASKKRFRK